MHSLESNVKYLGSDSHGNKSVPQSRVLGFCEVEAAGHAHGQASHKQPHCGQRATELCLSLTVNVDIVRQVNIPQKLRMSEVAPQRSRATGTNPVPAKVKNSQGAENSEVRRDCCGAIARYAAALKIEVL